MFRYAVAALVIALIAAFFGFSGGVTAGAVEIARILFYIFLIVGVVSFVIGMFGRRM